MVLPVMPTMTMNDAVEIPRLMGKRTTTIKSSTAELRTENRGRHEPYSSTAQGARTSSKTTSYQRSHHKPTARPPNAIHLGNGGCAFCWPHGKMRSSLFLYVETFFRVRNDPRLPSVHVCKYKYSHSIMVKRSNKVYAGVSLSSCSSRLVCSPSHVNIVSSLIPRILQI